MAGVEEESVEYESDPEEAKLSLKMRRREASDDEEEEGEEERENREKLLRKVDSEGESDGQGAAAEYDDDDEELDTEEEEEVEEGTAEEEEGEYEEREGEVGGDHGQVADAVAEGVVEVEKEVSGDGGSRAGGDVLEVQQEVNSIDQVNEEKKENEPFAVPTAGAFYMHDDRFREYVGGRHRRTRGGRKLWESKDDSKWGHDKFEELTTQQGHYEEGRRTSRGRYRGRGKNRGVDPGYPQGNRPKAYNNNIQNNAPKGVRGRGPRRYQPSSKNGSEAPPTQNKQFGKSVEKTLYASSGRVSAPASSVESDPVPARKHGFGSSLSSASPPFYPSGSSSKEISLSQKRDAQAGTISQNLRSSVMVENYSMSQPNAVLRGKNVVDSIGMDKLYIDESNSSVSGKPLTNLHVPPSGSSTNSTLSAQVQVQGRGRTPLGQVTQQPTSPQNQVNRVSSSTQLHSIQRHAGQSRIQLSLQASGQQWAQSPGRASSHSSSPPKEAQPINSLEPGVRETPPESSKSKTALVGKGKGSIHGSGRGSFLYGGAQVMGTSGNMGAGHGDQNFPRAPAFLQVMQFGGQHPGGMGVPAVGMAFPGYVAQPQLGLRNSEMTWLPVLAGAAGALGSSYCPPYIAVDGAYNARPPGQSSSSAASSSKENNTNKPINEWQPSQRSELANDEFGQRQNKLRRYTEMKFD
ncbi:unnamed protein product [Ilex paraguariensis]|uniref:Btz domain-containing protein n=1 Tax=Ilex paraguariensis TaxID=185542 RepID=A0ABC8TYR1_9AQUA